MLRLIDLTFGLAVICALIRAKHRRDLIDVIFWAVIFACWALT